MPKLAQGLPFPALGISKSWQGGARAWFLQMQFTVNYFLYA